jgi:hypothetical protein
VKEKQQYTKPKHHKPQPQQRQNMKPTLPSPTPTTLKISFLFTFALLCLRKQWIMVDEPSLSRHASSTTAKGRRTNDADDPLGVLRQPANMAAVPTKLEERALTIDPTPSEQVIHEPVLSAESASVTESTITESDASGTRTGVGAPHEERLEAGPAVEEENERIIDTSNITIKVQYPVFVASLYKSGTTTIHAYFECGKQKSVHYSANRQRTGPCLQRRIQKGLHPVFQGCGGDTFDIYTDNANLNAPRSCFDPSVHGLDAIYQSYPNATILMAVRDSQQWLDSVDRYRFRKWALLEDLMKCTDLWTTQQQDVGNRTLTRYDILRFYDWHTEHVRSFAAAHPSMTYIEVKLESDDTAQILEDQIGIPAQCWGHSNINTRHEAREGAPV